MKQSQKLRLTVFSFILMVSGCTEIISCKPKLALSGSPIETEDNNISVDFEAFEPGIKCKF